MNFVIAKKNSEYLDTPVFHAGADDQEEAVALFTDRHLAEKYIDEAQWAEEYEVGELQPVQLVRWLMIAEEQGTRLLAVDPNRNQHLDGRRQNVVFLDRLVTVFADQLNAEIEKIDSPPTPTD